MSHYRPSERDVIRDLGLCIQDKFSHNDIRDIYRIIHHLLELLTEDEHYNHHYNKQYIIMQCLYQFYENYPHGRIAVQSYSAYVSERLHEIKRDEYEKKRLEQRCSFSRCIIL